jgi:Uma2 family endonuclease
MTPGEYLELERKSEIRSEYIAGRMIAMSRSSLRHSLIAGNLLDEVSSQMRGRDGEAYAKGLRVKVSLTGMYTYPDVVAVCGEVRLEDEHFDTLLNPMVIVEVLSESTEAYDRGEKFAHYRRLDSLREYVLVAQDKVRVEHFRREGEEWICRKSAARTQRFISDRSTATSPSPRSTRRSNSKLQVPQVKRRVASSERGRP